MVAILPYAPAEFQAAVRTVDAAFPGLALTGCIHVPAAYIAERALHIVIDSKILYDNVAEIVAHKIPLSPGSDAHVPFLDNVNRSVIPHNCLDINVPDPGLIGKSRQGRREQPRQGKNNPAHKPVLFEGLDFH